MKRYRLTESNLRNMIRESLKKALNEQEDDYDDDYDDDDAFWERQHQEEMDYDMAMFTKAMQQANGTYSATSRDGQWKTGDKVSFKHDGNVINGTIVDFDNNFMTGEDVADIDYYNEEKGRIFTMIGVPLKYLSKMNESKLRGMVREAVRNALNESSDSVSSQPFGGSEDTYVPSEEEIKQGDKFFSEHCPWRQVPSCNTLEGLISWAYWNRDEFENGNLGVSWLLYDLYHMS